MLRTEDWGLRSGMRFLWWILLILWMGIICYVSGIPHFSTGTQGFLIRKIGHSLVFGVFTFLLWKSVLDLQLTLQKKIALVGVIVLCFAITDEGHQYFVDGRRGNIMGVLFDCIGGGVILSWFWLKSSLGKGRA